MVIMWEDILGIGLMFLILNILGGALVYVLFNNAVHEAVRQAVHGNHNVNSGHAAGGENTGGHGRVHRRRHNRTIHHRGRAGGTARPR